MGIPSGTHGARNSLGAGVRRLTPPTGGCVCRACSATTGGFCSNEVAYAKVAQERHYWNFSIDQQALEDTQRVIDHLLNVMQVEQITYVGRSQEPSSIDDSIGIGADFRVMYTSCGCWFGVSSAHSSAVGCQLCCCFILLFNANLRTPTGDRKCGSVKCGEVK